MTGQMIDYVYGNIYPKEDLSKWPAYSETSCRFIGQPTVTWDNIGSLLLKHNYYESVIYYFLHSDQNLFNVIKFIENNPNCVEVEILKRKHTIDSNTFFPGHHIFASSSINLKTCIDALPTISDSSVEQVKWIHNFGAEKETSVNEFLKTVEDLKINRYKNGVVNKVQVNYEKDSFEEHSHLWFILDLRRYCGDVSALNHDFEEMESKEKLIEYVNKFHKDYVECNKEPSQQITWTFLQTLRDARNLCKYIDKSLNWEPVRTWARTIDNFELIVNSYKKLEPGFNLIYPRSPFTRHACTSAALIQSAQNQFRTFTQRQEMNRLAQSIRTFNPSFKLQLSTNAKASNKQRFKCLVEQYAQFLKEQHCAEFQKLAIPHLVDKMKTINPSFNPDINFARESTHDQNIEYVISQYASFLKRIRSVKKTENLFEKIRSSPVEESVVFAMYERLFKTKIIEDLKVPESRLSDILTFFLETVKENGVIGSISVPQSSGVKEKLIIVVNGVKESEEDVQQQLFEIVKNKNLPVPFVNSRFNILFGTDMHKDLGLVEAFNLFKTIVTEDKVDRIDGVVVRERVVRETAAVTWTEGVTAATRFLMLSHVFLTHYYDNQDYQNVLKNDSKQQIKELIQKTTEMLTNLNKNDDQKIVNARKQQVERLTQGLYQLSIKLEWLLLNMLEGVEFHSNAVIDLNKLLSELIESKTIPKQSSV